MSEPLIQTRELDGCSIVHPLYQDHKRANNWFARCTGKNAANIQRSFLHSVGAIVDLSDVTVGDVLEVASNYTTSRGRTDRDRIYWRVLFINDSQLVVEKHSTAAQAMKAARLANAEGEVTA